MQIDEDILLGGITAFRWEWLWFWACLVKYTCLLLLIISHTETTCMYVHASMLMIHVDAMLIWGVSTLSFSLHSLVCPDLSSMSRICKWLASLVSWCGWPSGEWSVLCMCRAHTQDITRTSSWNESSIWLLEGLEGLNASQQTSHFSHEHATTWLGVVRGRLRFAVMICVALMSVLCDAIFRMSLDARRVSLTSVIRWFDFSHLWYCSWNASRNYL